MGGPVVKDKLWLWGSYGRSQINNVTAQGYPDRTTLEGFGGKLNAQIIPENTLTAVYSHNDKIKLGRNVSDTRPPEAAWNQSGPTKLYKIEDSHIFGSDFFATASYSRVIGGFQLVAEGQDPVYQDASGVYHNGYYNYYTNRPQTQATFTPSYFLRTGNVGHEIKAGFVYRTTPIGTTGSWPGGILAFEGANRGFGDAIAAFTRNRNNQTEQTYYSGFLSDTMTIDKLTVNVGVRYDKNDGVNAAGAQVAKDSRISPRLGVSWDIGGDGNWLANASYSHYVMQLANTSNVADASPAGAPAASGLPWWCARPKT